MTNLLVLTSEKEEFKGFDEEFSEVDYLSLADVSVNSGTDTKVEVKGREIKEYDSVYVQPEPKAAIYARVLLEGIQDEAVRANLEPNTFFILSKKHYLFKVLKEKGVSIPPTVAVPSQKGLTNVENDIEFPVVAKMYQNFNRVDIDKLGSKKSLKSFSERAEYGENYVLVQEFVEGNVFDALYIDGEIISLKLEGERWKNDEISRTYHTLSTEQKEVVEKAANSIGTDLCRIRLVGNKVVQVKSQLHLQRFKKISGKNVFGKVAKVLKGDRD